MNLSSYRGSHNLYDENPEIAGDAEGNFYITWNTSQPYEDMIIPHDVYWMKVNASGTPGEPQKISVCNLQCEPVNNVHGIPSEYAAALFACVMLIRKYSKS